MGGRCPFEDRCSFAHGVEELNPNAPQARPAQPYGAAPGMGGMMGYQPMAPPAGMMPQLPGQAPMQPPGYPPQMAALPGQPAMQALP